MITSFQERSWQVGFIKDWSCWLFSLILLYFLKVYYWNMLVAHSLNIVITDEDQDITWHWINLKGGWFTVVQNALSTFVDTKQKWICRWLNEGEEQTQKTNLGYTSWLEGYCKLLLWCSHEKKKVVLLRKDKVLIFEIWLWHLSGLICTIVVVYNWERVFVREATSWCGI